MDRAVGHIQLTADIPLGQIAVQQLEHPELPLRQLLISGLDAADLRWPVESSQPPGQDPRIGAGSEDGSRLGYRIRGTLVLAQGPEHRRLAEQRTGQLDRLPKGPREGNAAFDQRQCLIGPAARRVQSTILPAFPARSPTVALTWAMAIRSIGTYLA